MEKVGKVKENLRELEPDELELKVEAPPFTASVKRKLKKKKVERKVEKKEGRTALDRVRNR